NENLAREMLELHTLGVDGGYTQGDVIALAKVLTGWSIEQQRGPLARVVNVASNDKGFRFYPARHEPGGKTVLGKTYPEGYDGGVTVLRDLSRHPATARHIARKLAVHFISDNPPADSVARLEAVFRQTDGNLGVVYEALVDDPAAWKPAQSKVR